MQVGTADTRERCALVAEIGNNHEGSLALAEEMIGAAFDAGADAVKLQAFVPERLVSLQQRERLAQLSKFHIPLTDMIDIIHRFEADGRTVFVTPFDPDTLMSVSPHVALIKIASGDITYEPLLAAAAHSGLPLIVSTGASTLTEVSTAVRWMSSVWHHQVNPPPFALLHCVAEYPSAPYDVNLGALGTLQRAHPAAVIGYSDHCLGIDVAAGAAMSGARIVEKHFTLDRSYSDYRDHRLSADPAMLAVLRERLDEIASLLGTGEKQPTAGERGGQFLIRRSLHTALDLPQGHRLARDDISVVRPDEGLAPSMLDSVVGRFTTRSLLAGSPLTEEAVMWQ